MNREVRTVSREHALTALRDAAFRMNAYLYMLQKYDPGDDDAMVIEMAAEGAYKASRVALEVIDRLNLADSSGLPEPERCFHDWRVWLDDRGPVLKIADPDTKEDAA